MKQLLIFALVVTLIAATQLWKARSRRHRQEAWEQFAASRQLGYARGQIAGIASGFTVAMLVETRGQGRNQRDVALVRCSLNGAVPSHFSLERETLGDKLVGLIGRADHQLGIPDMDSAFHLENVGDEARSLLSLRSVQQVLLDSVRVYPTLRIAKGVVELETSHVPNDEKSLSKFLGDAVAVATALQRGKLRS